MKTVTGLLFFGMLLIASQAWAQSQCSQGSTYCDTQGYCYTCVCYTGIPCRWMYTHRR
jgi:hypothetical protein